MIDSLQVAKLLVAAIAVGALGACEKAESPVTAPPAAAASQFKPTAGIQDIMAHMIDPAADFLWQAVSSTVTAEGVEEKQPRTAEEWNEVRRQAVILAESANLLLMEGRAVAREGRQLEDHGTPGNLTAEESEQAIAADRASYVAFSHALHDVGAAMLKASADRSPQAIVDAGETLDQVCEGCHLKFWYPGQKIPAFPDQAPEPR
jgi:hypothetical protein